MIRLHDICKSFNEKEVLRSLNLNVKKGEMFVLLGSSGCGKTTALSIIAGLIREDKGDKVILKFKATSVHVII